MGFRNASADAQRVLAKHGSDPMGGVILPVDPSRIAKSMGVNVFTATLESGVSGMLMKSPGKAAAIYLNSEDGRNRQRFSCAHELGHFVKREEEAPDEAEFAYADYRDGRASTGTDSEEIYANRFAAELLMPANEVRSLHRQGFELWEMADRFGVSSPAMGYRLTNLNLG